MYSRILVPLDGSKVAEQVLPYVRLLAPAFQVPVHLLRTFGPLPLGEPNPSQDLYRKYVVNYFRTQAEEYLGSIQTSLADLDVPLSSAVYEGKAASWILREAEPEGTLIAMSSHGRSGLRRWVLGSVTDEVLHAADKPMLVVRSREEKGYSPEVELKTVVVPLDGSAEAEQVLPHVVTLAKALNLNVYLVRVTSEAFYYGEADYSPLVYPELLEAADEQAREYLHKVAEGLRRRGVATVQARVSHGHTPQAIEDLVRDTPGTMVALASHGRSGFERLVLGSVADHLVRRSGDPVLIVPRSMVRENQPMQARHLMSSPVVTISEGAPVSQAVALMLERNVSCLPVIGAQDRVVGILTHSDFSLYPTFLMTKTDHYALIGSWARPKTLQEIVWNLENTEVREFMRSPVVTVQEDTPLSELVDLMLRKGIHRLPVLRGAELVGIITRHDLLKLLLTSPVASATV